MSARKKYRPYGVNPNAHLMAMMGASFMGRNDVIRRAGMLREAIELASQGKATTDDWRLIFDCVNLTEELARQKVVQGMDVLDGLQDTIEALMNRHKATGTKALRATELAALRDFAADYAEVMCGVTKQQYMHAQRAYEDRIRRIVATEIIPASLRVVEA